MIYMQLTRTTKDKVCFELHEINFAAQNPCSMLVGLTPKS